jgi:hypothetical protein
VVIAIVIVIAFVFAAGATAGFMFGFSRAMREVASKMQSTSKPIAGWLFISTGSLAFGATLISFLYMWQFTRVAELATGVVIEMHESTDKDGNTIYAPTFRFEDASGGQHVVSSRVYSSPKQFNVGQNVRVLYRTSEPQNARIDSYWQLWGLPTVFGILGGVLLPIGFIALYWHKIRSRFSRDQIPSFI